MEVFPPKFADVYNSRWGTFAEHIAPRIKQFYESLPIAENERGIFDLCCGTGQLAHYFLEHGYRVIGSDLSEAMLEHARTNNRSYISSGQALFFQADAAEFELDEQVGLAVATGEALNHLPNHQAFKSCLALVRPTLRPGGALVFDLRTSKGFSVWNNMTVENIGDGGIIVKSGVYAGQGEAVQRIVGFDRAADDYKRFEQVVDNIVLPIGEVVEDLRQAGFDSISVASVEDLGKPVPAPESEDRVALIARA
jgi:SAM-dependent methyltransferase